MNENASAPRAGEPGPLAKFFGLVGGALLLALGFAFSLVALAVAAVVGAGFLAYFWWKTRALRSAMRAQAAAGAARAPHEPGDGIVIEGEAVVVETRAVPPPRLPDAAAR